MNIQLLAYRVYYFPFGLRTPVTTLINTRLHYAHPSFSKLYVLT
jgi:hypothetical protein